MSGPSCFVFVLNNRFSPVITIDGEARVGIVKGTIEVLNLEF